MTDAAPYKAALVTDWLTVRAGSARVLEAVLEPRPDAPVYTLVYDAPHFRDSIIATHAVSTSFLQRLPLVRRAYRMCLPLMPLAVERFDLRPYDVVISLSHAVAKGVLTGGDQLHISYVYTPVRYAWDLQLTYLDDGGWNRRGLVGLVHPLLHYVRLWDLASGRRPDVLVAASRYVARRIRKLYGRSATVTYPPVEIDRFEPRLDREDFYVTVSRLVSYKKVGLLAEAFSRLGRRLVVIGDGPERQAIECLAGPTVQVLGWQPDAVVASHLERCRAFVFAADEDFGIAPVEALAAGAPVIAYGRGGVTETVTDGETGIFFDRQDVDHIVRAVLDFEAAAERFPPRRMRQAAAPFARERFQREFAALVDREWHRFLRRRSPRHTADACAMPEA